MKKSRYCFDSLMQLLSNKPDVDLITPSDSRYPVARLIYNRMHDYYPGLIVRTLNIDHLRVVIQFAFENDIVLAIRGGGHHIGGFGTCNDGIVIDFSPFKEIRIDAEKNIASVSPGACLADIDRVLCNNGYVIPTGTVSATGVAGLTLGGGIGWLIGNYGLTCDQLYGADVLLADGRLVKAEDAEHKDLLWALKGGGGNFGIVLNFRYKLHKLPKVICGMGEVAWENAAGVMSKLSQYLVEKCPQTMTIAPVFLRNKVGGPSLRIDFCCSNGTEQDVGSLLALSAFISWSNVKEWKFPAWQSEFDHILAAPKRGYWKAAYIKTFTPEIIKTICHWFEKAPLGECTILIEHLHGAFKTYNQTTSAFPLRHTNFGILISARWEDHETDQTYISWVRKSFDAIDPLGLSATYLNYTPADDQRAVQNLLDNTVTKIINVKSFYDPDNLFKRNHNVLPSSSEAPTFILND